MNKNSVIGFIASLLLHTAAGVGLFILATTPKKESEPQMIAFSIDSFVEEAKAGENSQPASAESQQQELEPEPEPEPEPTPPEPEPEPIVEPEPIPEPVVEKPKPKEPEKKKEPKKKPRKKDENLTKVAKKPNLAPAFNPNQQSANSGVQGNAGSSSASSGKDAISQQGDPNNSDIGKKIRAIISRYAQSHYPNNAKRRKQTGIVGVTFTYKANGEVTNLRVYSSSGSDSLDEGALTAVERTKGSFPKVDQDTTYKFQIAYKLNFM